MLETSAGENETALRLTVEAGGCSGFSYKCVMAFCCFLPQQSAVSVPSESASVSSESAWLPCIM